MNLFSSFDTVTVNDVVTVSGASATSPNANSASGGNIDITSGKPTGVAINIGSTAQLLSLLNSTGPGGIINIASTGGDVQVSGKIQADRGQISIQNTAVPGVVVLSAANLSADTIKVGAIGTNGQLTITAGSSVSANTLLELYGGNGALGLVSFKGNGTVNISGATINIAATKVQIANNTMVQNAGTTTVFATTHAYGQGSGPGNFQNPVTQKPIGSAPGF